jgi:hypothetical protein
MKIRSIRSGGTSLLSTEDVSYRCEMYNRDWDCEVYHQGWKNIRYCNILEVKAEIIYKIDTVRITSRQLTDKRTVHCNVGAPDECWIEFYTQEEAECFYIMTRPGYHIMGYIISFMYIPKLVDKFFNSKLIRKFFNF